MNVISGPGNDLAGLDKTQYCIVKCTVTGSGLIADHVYESSQDGNSWIDISSIADHTHTGTGDGGTLGSVLRGSPTFVDTASKFLFNLAKADWIQTISGTGTITDDTDGATNEKSIKLLTGTTTGSGSTIALTGNLKLDFNKSSHFQTMLKLSSTTTLALKVGVDCETVTNADDNNPKYEAQLCTATNNNWNVRTATGSANSESNSGIAFTTGQVSIRLEHFPTLGTPKIDMYVDSAAAFTKTSDIPVSGSSDLLALMKFSLKNSAAADKNCFVYGARLRYYTSSQWK